MNVQPFDWNVVVPGYWNPAILTPAGIGQRLFGLDEGTPILVEVPMDRLAPYRVKHEGLTITAEMGRLVVHTDEPKYDGLERAKAIATKAIEGLPETPVTAAGFNVRVRIDDVPDELLTATECQVDKLLSDADFTIESRVLQRTLKWKDGVLKLSIHQEEDVRIELNFHRQSTKREELVVWLKRPIIEVVDAVSTVFEKVIGIPIDGMGK